MERAQIIAQAVQHLRSAPNAVRAQIVAAVERGLDKEQDVESLNTLKAEVDTLKARMDALDIIVRTFEQPPEEPPPGDSAG